MAGPIKEKISGARFHPMKINLETFERQKRGKDYKLYKKCERYVATLKKSKKSAYSMAVSKRYSCKIKPTESNYKLFHKRIQKCKSLIAKGIRSIHPSQFLA